MTANTEQGIDIAKIFNIMLTLALIGVIAWLLYNGGIVREKLVIVQMCGDEEQGRQVFYTQEEYNQYIEDTMKKLQEAVVNDAGG